MEKRTKPVAKTLEQMKKKWGYCSTGYPCSQCPTYKNMWRLWKNKSFQGSVEEQQWKKSVAHEIEQEATVENCIDMVNVNCLGTNSKWSIIVAKLKISSGQNRAMIPYKGDAGSTRNIMPIHTFRVLFHESTKTAGWTKMKTLS